MRPSRWLVLTVALGAAVSASAAVAQPAQGLGVAVVDFYAPSPLPPVEGVTVETLGADDLARLVGQRAGSGVTVLPRETVRQAESAMGWQGADALRFARLQELARALKTDRLLIGWIQRFDLERGTNGGGQSVGRNLLSGFATVTVQIFDAAQGRIVSQVQESAYELGIIRGRVAERLLLTALERTLPSVLAALQSAGR